MNLTVTHIIPSPTPTTASWPGTCITILSDSKASSIHVFFQAEDGMRDLTGTGVQTCALPICRPVGGVRELPTGAHEARHGGGNPLLSGPPVGGHRPGGLADDGRADGRVGREIPVLGAERRPEERRVGKEGRTGGRPDH